MYFFLLFMFLAVAQAVPFHSHQGYSKRQNISSTNSPDWDLAKTPFPSVKRDDSISFSYPSAFANGSNVTVGDPYHWFEDTQGSQVEIQSFIQDQGNFTQTYLDKISDLDTIRTAIVNANNYTLIGLPYHGGPQNAPLFTYFVAQANDFYGIFYIATNDELQTAIQSNFSSLPGKKLLDTSLVGNNKTVLEVNLSPDGTKIAYKVTDIDFQVSANVTIYFRDVSSPLITGDSVEGGQDHYPKDVLAGDAYLDGGWSSDSKTYFYQYAESVQVDNVTVSQESLRLHTIGTDPKEDPILVQPSPDPDNYLSFDISDDLEYIIVYMDNLFSTGYNVYIAKLDAPITAPLKWVAIQKDSTASARYATNIGTDFYFTSLITDSLNQLDHLVLDVNSAKATANLSEISQGTFNQELLLTIRSDLDYIGLSTFDTDKVVLYYVQVDVPLLEVHDLKTGKSISQFIPPQPFEYIDAHTVPTGKDVLLYASTLSTPIQLYQLSWDDDKKAFDLTNFYQAKAGGVDPNKYVLEQKYATSLDGTQIPFFAFYRKGIQFDGTQPSILTFGGAFEVDVNLFYYGPFLAFLELFDGVVLAAAVRGGGDVTSTNWHVAGSLLNKTHVFDDIFAVANYAIEQKFTDKGKIILDLIADGAMAGAVVVNRDHENIFGALLAQGALYDVLRLDQSADNVSVIAEYGDPHSVTYFDLLFAYSPLDNINKSQKYPATYLSKGYYQSWHTYKYLSNLQYIVDQNPNPILLGDPAVTYDEHKARSYAVAAHSLGLKPSKSS